MWKGTETNLAEIDSLNNDWQYQIAMQLLPLEEEINKFRDIEAKDDNRLFRCNPFDDIEASKRNHLEHQLLQSLRTLGCHLDRTGTVSVVDKTSLKNFKLDNHGVIMLKPSSKVKYSTCAGRKAELMLKVIAQVVQRLRDDDYMSARELHYKTKTILSQTTTTLLHTVLSDLCCLLGCSRVHLRILSQPKGIVYGNLKFRLKNNEKFDCLASGDGTYIPTPRSPIVEMTSDARMIIIVEKDSVLQKIIKQESSSEFVTKYKVILFTARGYPDINSRAFLKKLWSHLKIPTFVLVDANPHGAEIACCYKFGCFATANEAAHYAMPHIRWLGVLPSDIKDGKVPQESLMNLSSNDYKKLASLMKRPSLQARKDWLSQLKLMRDLGKKAELESLDTHEGYLTRTFLPNKLRFSFWL